MSNTNFPMALDVLCVSDTQFELMVDHKFGKAFMRLSVYFLLNYNVNTGAIHRVRVREIASRAGVGLGDVYAFKTFAKKICFADFSIQNMKLTGKLKHYPKVRWSDDDDTVVEVNQMKVAMIHRDGVRLLMENRVTGSQLRLAIATAFHCDVRTGTLHEEHPETWADRIGRFRTTVTRGLEKLNEIGFLQSETDYLVYGRLPWTAYARGWFEQHRIAKVRMEKGYTSELKAKFDFINAQRWLREGYGLCTDLLNTTEKVMRAAKALRPWATDAQVDGSQSVGYHLTKSGGKHWTDKDKFMETLDAREKASPRYADKQKFMEAAEVSGGAI